MNNQDIIPIKFEGLEDSIYAGFWLRLGSGLVDLVILLPISAFIIYINGFDIKFIYLTSFLNLGVFYFFHIYFVENYGGTPGKLIVGIQIINVNGKKANSRNAWMRQIIAIVFSICGLILTVIAIQSISNGYYIDLDWIQRSQLISEQYPLLFAILNTLSVVWVLSELVILLSNKRRRGLHDYIGDTLVIKKKYFVRLTKWLEKKALIMVQCPNCKIKKKTKQHGKFICSNCNTRFESNEYLSRILTVHNIQ